MYVVVKWSQADVEKEGIPGSVRINHLNINHVNHVKSYNLKFQP